MKLPLPPPKLNDIFSTINEGENGPDRFFEIMNSGISKLPAGRYLHWDQLRHRKPPEGFTHEEWWFAVKNGRHSALQVLPFTDEDGHEFAYALPDFVHRMLHEVDKNASGRIEVPSLIANPQTRDRYLIRSLIEEAITSSQLEGASTTHLVAKNMLKEGRKPRDRNEQMIFNNYAAMQFIRENHEEPLTKEFVLELQRILTEKTIDDDSIVGRFRTADEDIKVVDNRDGTILYIPPPASQLEDRMKLLCKFANDETNEPFIHPVIRAILIHFMLAYDHPFVDGNGRTARALFYWSMVRQDYWMSEFISISRILRNAPSKYARAYLHTESDDNDTTYFIIYQLQVILSAIEALHEYLARKAKEISESEQMIRKSPRLREALNHRQVVILDHALKHPYERYTVQSHRKSHNVTYETSRQDLLSLAELGLLHKGKSGRAFVFSTPEDLRERLQKLGSMP